MAFRCRGRLESIATTFCSLGCFSFWCPLIGEWLALAPAQGCQVLWGRLGAVCRGCCTPLAPSLHQASFAHPTHPSTHPPPLSNFPVQTCRAFGDPDFKEPLHLVTATPDVIRERLLPGDEFVILASDGLVS